MTFVSFVGDFILKLTSVLFRANQQKHKDCNDQKQNRQPSHKSRHCTSVSCNYSTKFKVIFYFIISQLSRIYVRLSQSPLDAAALPWVALHCVTLVAPVASVVPSSGHATHVCWNSWSWYVPRGQGSHVESGVCCSPTPQRTKRVSRLSSISAVLFLFIATNLRSLCEM